MGAATLGGGEDREVGASAVEYGLLLAAIASVLLVAAIALGSTVQGLFSNTCDDFRSAASSSTAGAAGSC